VEKLMPFDEILG